MATVSLEAAQVRALSVDTDRAQANDDVTLYVASIEQQLREAEKQLSDIIPKLQKVTGEMQHAVNKQLEAEQKTGGKKLEDKYKKVANFLTKEGFKGCTAKAHATSSDKEGQLAFMLSIEQAEEYSSDDIWLGSRKGHTKVYLPTSQDLKNLQAQSNSMHEKLASAQQELLKVKVDLQKVDMYERQGKALVIRNSRMQTTAGKALVEEIEGKAAGQLANVVAYVKELEKSTKLLTSSKK